MITDDSINQVFDRVANATQIQSPLSLELRALRAELLGGSSTSKED